MCGDIKIKNVALISADKSIHLTTPVGIIGDDDLPSFVSKLLDQYDEEGRLTWHAWQNNPGGRDMDKDWERSWWG